MTSGSSDQLLRGKEVGHLRAAVALVLDDLAGRLGGTRLRGVDGGGGGIATDVAQTGVSRPRGW